MTTGRTVAFIGLGVMGYPMAGHLARAGHAVTVYNRTAAKAERFAREFSAPQPRRRRARRPRAPMSCSACVGNDDDLRAVTLGETGAFAGMKPGAIFVDHTTASAKVARELFASAQGVGPRLYRRSGLGRPGRRRKGRADGDVRRRGRRISPRPSRSSPFTPAPAG